MEDFLERFDKEGNLAKAIEKTMREQLTVGECICLTAHWVTAKICLHPAYVLGGNAYKLAAETALLKPLSETVGVERPDVLSHWLQGDIMRCGGFEVAWKKLCGMVARDEMIRTIAEVLSEYIEEYAGNEEYRRLSGKELEETLQMWL